MVTDPGGNEERFQTTRWSLVRAAGASASPESQAALAALCRIYWPPVYAFLRRRGNDEESAKDLTQGFFTDLLEKNRLKSARQERGRFRSFLLASAKNFAANEWDRSQAKKRGGGTPPIPFDLSDAESVYQPALEVRGNPEAIFELRWAITLLKQVHARLEQEMEGAAGHERFLRLKPFLTGEATGLSYKKVASELGMGESAVKVAVHRLRHRFGRILREEVAQTLTDPAMIDEEIRFLLGVIAS